MLDGVCWELTIVGETIDGKGCGLWQTPDTMCGMKFRPQDQLDRIAKSPRKGRARPGKLTDQVAVKEGLRMWPTPKAQNKNQPCHHGHGGPDLQTAVQNFPTPKSRDWKGKTQRGTHKPEDGLCNTLDCTGGQLNPDWVEWLMCWPEGWTSLEPMSIEHFNEWKDNVMDNWTTEPDIPRVAKGVKNRVARLKAIGNGQVPLCVSTVWELLTGGGEYID